MNEHQDSRGVATLLSDLAQQVTTLLQTEARLLRAEMSEKFSNVGSGAVEILGGAVCLLAALIVLLQALVIALAEAGLGAVAARWRGGRYCRRHSASHRQRQSVALGT